MLLSGQSLGNRKVLNLIAHFCEQAYVSPGIIKFEITETAAVANLRDANIFIHALTNLGYRFALDDFGSGLSSFGYLKNLPVSTLKIDGMFVRDIVDDPIDEAIVRSINDIGHVMQMKTIAEFVENDAIKERLISIGVDCAQVYGIGKPHPLDVTLHNCESV